MNWKFVKSVCHDGFYLDENPRDVIDVTRCHRRMRFGVGGDFSLSLLVSFKQLELTWYFQLQILYNWIPYQIMHDLKLCSAMSAFRNDVKLCLKTGILRKSAILQYSSRKTVQSKLPHLGTFPKTRIFTLMLTLKDIECKRFESPWNSFYRWLLTLEKCYKRFWTQRLPLKKSLLLFFCAKGVVLWL